MLTLANYTGLNLNSSYYDLFINPTPTPATSPFIYDVGALNMFELLDYLDDNSRAPVRTEVPCTQTRSHLNNIGMMNLEDLVHYLDHGGNNQ